MNRTVWLPLIICLAVALALLVVQGAVTGERAYAAFQAARDFRGLPDLEGLHSPLFLVLLAGAGKLGLSIPSTGVLLSAAGWLVAIAAVYVIGLRFDRPVIAVFAAGALALEPTLPALIGQGTLFVMGWLWSALANIKFQISSSKYQVLNLKSANPQSAIRPPASDFRNWMAVLALAVLVASIVYHALHASTITLWENYGPALLPALALLAGLISDKLIALTARLPFTWRRDERLAFEAALVVLALMGLGYLRGTAQAWSSASRGAATERLALWEQAGLWLQKNTSPESTVWSDENGVLGYFSERHVVNAASPGAPPDYIITVNSLTWAERVSQPWFRERYQRVTAMTNPYDSQAPLTIYHYRPSLFDAGPVVNVGAHFGESLELLSYQLDSTLLIPGEDSHLTLTWQAFQPLPKALNVRVRLYDSASRRIWAEVVNATPANAKSQLWPVGRPLTDRYTLQVPDNLPPGAYQVQVQVLHAENEVIPETNIEHTIGDAVTLAQLEAQPWISDTPLTADHPLTATFGDREGGAIELTGYTVPSRVERGEVLRVRIYWHVRAVPGQSYHVFTHLLTADNRLVAQQDSVPVYETYPTNQWQVGQYILDEHLIPIDAATPPGRYWLKVGLYTLETGERLAARDQAGRDVPDQSLRLIQVDVQ